MRGPVCTFSETTIPEANALIRDLRRTSASLSSLTDKPDQQGAGAVLGQQAARLQEMRTIMIRYSAPATRRTLVVSLSACID